MTEVGLFYPSLDVVVFVSRGGNSLRSDSSKFDPVDHTARVSEQP